MHHPRFMLLASLVLGLCADAARAGEPFAGPARAVFQVQRDGFRVMPAASRRRRDDGGTSGDTLIVRGTFECPGGYQQVFQGYIFAFEQKTAAGGVAQFGDVDPTCWPLSSLPPMETTFLGNWQKVAMCVVCVRNLDQPLTGSAPFSSSPNPGGNPDVPSQSGRNPADPPNDDSDDDNQTSTNPIPGA